jgi:hypothetical protein
MVGLGMAMNGANLYGYLRCKYSSGKDVTNFLSAKLLSSVSKITSLPSSSLESNYFHFYFRYWNQVTYSVEMRAPQLLQRWPLKIWNPSDYARLFMGLQFWYLLDFYCFLKS